MKVLTRFLVGIVLVMAGGIAGAARDDAARSAQWAEAAKRQAAEMQRMQRAARLRWEYQRRRSAAHARMLDTLYASTPDRTVTDLSCPVLTDDARGIRRRHRNDRDPMRVPGARSAISPQSSNLAIDLYPADRRGGPTFPSSGMAAEAALSRGVHAGGWSMAADAGAAATAQYVYLFPSASEPLRQGFVRVINHSSEAGDVRIEPVDDSGRAFDALTLSIDADATVHFNSDDLENGNAGKGLSGQTGSGQGDWRADVHERSRHRGAGLRPHAGRFPDGHARRGAGGRERAPGGDL